LSASATTATQHIDASGSASGELRLDKPVTRLERDTALPSDKAKAAMIRKWNELQGSQSERVDFAPGGLLPRRELLLAIRGQAPKHWVSFYQVARGMRSHKIHQLFLVTAKGDYKEDEETATEVVQAAGKGQADPEVVVRPPEKSECFRCSVESDCAGV